MRDIPTRSQLEELKLMVCAKAGKSLLRARPSDKDRPSDTDTICDYCECAIYCEDDSFCAIQKCIDFVRKVGV